MAARGAGTIVGLVLGIVLTAVGYGVTFWVGRPMRERARESSSWPSTDGTIVRSMLEETHKDGTTMRTADIGYEYRLDGAVLTGSRVWIGDGYSASPGEEFRAAVRRYPVGREVRVHYDPLDPAESVLEPGATWSASLAFLIGAGVLALGGLILASALVPVLVVIVALATSAASPWPDESRLPERGGGTPPDGDSQPEDDGISIG